MMNGSRNPTQKFINRASAKAALADPTEIYDEFSYGVDQNSADLFKKELKALQEYNDLGDGRRRNVIVLPPPTVYGLFTSKHSKVKVLQCAGYNVRNV